MGLRLGSGQNQFAETRIWDAPANISISGLSFNNLGQIAFSVYDSDLVQYDIYLYANGSVVNITRDLDVRAFSPSINDVGQITFVGQDTDNNRRDIYLYDGNSISNITAGLELKNVDPPSLNNLGQIAFVGEDPGSGRKDIYLYASKNVSNITARLDISGVSSFSLNNQGQIAFISQSNDQSRSDLYLYAEHNISNLTLGIEIIRETYISLNDKGQMAIETYSGYGLVLYFYDGKELQLVTPEAGGTYGVPHAAPPDINNKGQAVYPIVYCYFIRLTGTRCNTVTYFYSGPPASHARSSPGGDLNDAGQIASHTAKSLYLATTINIRPVARAGTGQQVEPRTEVRLDASASIDPDNNPLTYHWTLASKPRGSQATLSDITDIHPSLVADVVGFYEVQLVVSDGQEQSEPSKVLIIARERSDPKPIAYAGRDRVVLSASTVYLDASPSYNPGTDNLIYYWSFISKPAGSQATLTGAETAKPSFYYNRDGRYQIELIVENSRGQSQPDIVTIFVIGIEYQVQVAAAKPASAPANAIDLLIWAGNAGAPTVVADAFIGIGYTDNRLCFLNPSFDLVSSEPADSRTFTPFAQNVSLPSGRLFPSVTEMNADSDGNGKLDSYRLCSITLPAGSYFAFAGLAVSGTAQSGTPSLIGQVSIYPFNLTP